MPPPILTSFISSPSRLYLPLGLLEWKRVCWLRKGHPTASFFKFLFVIEILLFLPLVYTPTTLYIPHCVIPNPHSFDPQTVGRRRLLPQRTSHRIEIFASNHFIRDLSSVAGCQLGRLVNRSDTFKAVTHINRVFRRPKTESTETPTARPPNLIRKCSDIQYDSHNFLQQYKHTSAEHWRSSGGGGRVEMRIG